MATSQQFLVCDSSTLANFKQWAQAISAFFATATWTQSTDTGQVNWSTISAVPGTGAYVYEIWQPNDGLTNFYVKMEYGNVSGSANCPSLRITISSATNGAGTPSGLVMGPTACGTTVFTAPSTTTQYECDLSGAPGRINAMMWRNGANNCQQAFGIERSLNSGGSYTGSHVTLIVAGWCGGNNNNNVIQQSLVLGVGVYPFPGSSANRQNNPGGGLYARFFSAEASSGPTSSAFNGSIPFDTAAPLVGFFDYPLTMFGVAAHADIVEGVTFSATLYGASRTFMPSKNSAFFFANPYSFGTNFGTAFGSALCMRYD
jgi:hypothetical protein